MAAITVKDHTCWGPAGEQRGGESLNNQARPEMIGNGIVDHLAGNASRSESQRRPSPRPCAHKCPMRISYQAAKAHQWQASPRRRLQIRADTVQLSSGCT